MADDREFKLHNGKVGAALTVHITPRSRQNQIKEILKDGTIHLSIKSSSENRDINKALIEFLSQILEIKKDDIEIIAGEQGLDKLVTILNIDPDSAQSKITKHLI
jgi:uncharacterized protein YggU (UPF0235/DUF167 family)